MEKCTRLCSRPIIWMDETVRPCFQKEAFAKLEAASPPDTKRSMCHRAQAYLLTLTGQADHRYGAYDNISHFQMAQYIEDLKSYGKRLRGEEWTLCKLEYNSIENIRSPLRPEGSRFIYLPTVTLWCIASVQGAMKAVLAKRDPAQHVNPIDNVVGLDSKPWFNILLPSFADDETNPAAQFARETE